MDHVELLLKLATKWRDHYKSERQYGEYGEFGARGFVSCADELEAVIAAMSAKPEAAEANKPNEDWFGDMLASTGVVIPFDCAKPESEAFAYVEVSKEYSELHFPRRIKRGSRGNKQAARELPLGLHPLYLHPPRSHGVVVDGKICCWSQQDEQGDVFDSGCGHTYIILDGETGGMKYCTFCGGKIEFEMWKDEDDKSALVAALGEGES